MEANKDIELGFLMSGEHEMLQVIMIPNQQSNNVTLWGRVRLHIKMAAPQEYNHAEMHGLWDTANESFGVFVTYGGVICCKTMVFLSVV